MNPTILCVTTILFGSFDSLRPPIIDYFGDLDPSWKVQAFVISDQLDWDPPSPYVKVYIPNFSNITSRQAARQYKLLPPIWDRCHLSIQHDANVQLLKSPTKLAKQLLPEHELGLVRHPFLSSYHAEIQHLCQVYPKDCTLYQKTRDSYMHTGTGSPFDPGTAVQYETSFMIRRHTPGVHAFMKQWYDDLIQSGHLRDQVILAPLLYTTATTANLAIQLYPGHNIDFAKWHCHAKVMGQTSQYMTHSLYCGVYYCVKRYAPWIERWLAPLSFTALETIPLRQSWVTQLVVMGIWLLFCGSIVWSHHRRIQFPLKRHQEQLQLSILGAACVAGCLACMVATFYTIPMGILVLWPCTCILTPCIWILYWQQKKKTKRQDHVV